METRERDKVNSKLPEVRVQLSRESKTARDATHGSRDKMVKITNWDKAQQTKYSMMVSSYVFSENYKKKKIESLITRTT